MLLAALALSAWPRQAEAGATGDARDLAMEAKRLMDGGDLPASLSAFRSAREAFESSAPPDVELAGFLGLHLYNLGVRLNNAGDPDGALACFVEALRVGRVVGGRLRDQGFRTTLADATLKVASFLVASGRPDPAVEACQLVSEGPSGDVRGLMGLGAAHLARGDYAGALAAYNRAAVVQPDAPEVAAGRGRAALLMASRAEEGEAQALLEKGAGWLRRARELDPTSAQRGRELADALVRLGAAAARAGDIAQGAAAGAEADEEYRRAVAIEPTSPWPRLDLANRLLRVRRYEEAASQFERAATGLDDLIAASPADANAASWRTARELSRENRAVALFNLAVDAINRADFSRVESFLSVACATGPSWDARCRELREAARVREETFRQAIGAHEAALKEDPHRAVDLLALGDLYAGVGDYDRALERYRRVERLGAPIPDLADRIAAVIDPGVLTERRKNVDLVGARVEVRHFAPTLDPSFETALKAAWLRVTSAMGESALSGELAVTVYPNRRAFRQGAGYRVGAMVKGYYTAGHISVFSAPSYSALEWVAVLTHELGHHAVEKISGGRAPWWLSEGTARYVEGDSAVVDRARLRVRLEAGLLGPIARLDETFERYWNDPVAILDARDEALLAVEEMIRRGGGSVLRDTLARIADPAAEPGAVLRRVVGADLAEIDSGWRASLLGKSPLRPKAPPAGRPLPEGPGPSSRSRT
jgi:tetratricopeptide (TPR) repeat protein